MLLGETWKQLDSEVSGSGFKKGGIVPYNRNVVPKEKYDPQAWKRSVAFKKNYTVTNNDVEENSNSLDNNVESVDIKKNE